MARTLKPSDLLEAACSGDVEEVMKLVQVYSTDQSENRDSRVACLNDKDLYGLTALHLAVKQDHVVAIQTLVRAGADIDIRDDNVQRTPLMHAVILGKLPCVQELIQLGADMSCNDSEGLDGTLLAACFGQENCLKFLLERPDLNIQEGSRYRHDHYLGGALIYAAHNHHANCIQVLLEAGANVNTSTTHGETALHVAFTCDPECRFNHSAAIECVKILLSAGADVNARTIDRETVLMSLAKWEFVYNQATVTECLRILLNAGADVNMQTSDGETALTTLIRRVRFNFNVTSSAITEYVKILIDSGTNLTHITRSEENMLMYASMIDDLVVFLPSLVEAGVLIDQQDSEGKTALAHAAQNGSISCAVWLVSSGANVIIRSQSGDTPLHYLMYSLARDINSTLEEVQELISLLVSKNADVNATNNKGQTPLMCVAPKLVAREVMTTLLEHGADLNRVDNKGQTALIHCIEKIGYSSFDDDLSDFGVIQIINAKFLLDKGANFSIGKLADGALSNLTALFSDLDLIQLKVGQDVDLEVSWMDFLHVIHKGNRKILQFLIVNGVMPSQTASETIVDWAYEGIDLFSESVLEMAARNNVAITKYMIASCYLCSNDLTIAANRSHTYRKKSEVINNLLSQPWPLVKLCFVVVSTAFGASPGRQERVKNSQLPPKLQKMLLFQEPWSRLCVHQWDKIPITFSWDDYEKLPRPRPLLFHWPVGHVLVPCDCGECDGTMYQYEKASRKRKLTNDDWI